MDLNIRIAGEAGQGLASVGDLLAQAFVRSGLHVFTGQSYMSRIRGGLNWSDIRIADAELFGMREKADILIALTGPGLKHLRDHVTPQGVILYNGSGASNAVCFDFAELARSVGGRKIMINSIAAGGVFALLGYDLGILTDYLREKFSRKSDEVVDQNIRCARAGYEKVVGRKLSIPAPRPGGAPKGTLTNGATATGLSAAVAGVKFVSSYPMSPSTATLGVLAKLSDEFGIVVEQAEDEIAAINMVCGAAYAGVPAMTTTSGGGFALMAEGVSLAGMMELPAVILLAQRPGPATGLPTRTGQEDLAFAVFAGHGEFPKAIFAPGSHQQCYAVMRHALEIAHRFQTPSILLTDQFLQDSMKNIPPLDRQPNPIDRCLLSRPGNSYKRYRITPGGVSPRAIPGGAGLVVCDSDEHDDAGHITEDLETRIAMQHKRMAKMEGMLRDFLPPERIGPARVDTLYLCWGSSYGPVCEAVETLRRKKRSVGMLHFPQVWPLDMKRIARMLQPARQLVVVEGNYTGQFAALLRMAGCARQMRQINRFDGLPVTAEYILEEAIR